MLSSLTVMELLWCSASLRLPADTPAHHMKMWVRGRVGGKTEGSGAPEQLHHSKRAQHDVILQMEQARGVGVAVRGLRKVQLSMNLRHKSNELVDFAHGPLASVELD